MNERPTQKDVDWHCQWTFDEIFNFNSRTIAKEFRILQGGQKRLRDTVNAISDILCTNKMEASLVIKESIEKAIVDDELYAIGILYLMVHHGMLRPFKSVEPSARLAQNTELISTGAVHRVGNIVASLFGLQLGDDGLDFLFGGGLLMPEFGGITLALEGDPGSGKTTFAAQMIFSLLRGMKKSKIGLYVSIEERIDELIYLIQYFGLASKHSIEVFSRDQLSDALKALRSGKRVIVLTHLPEKTLEAAIDLVEGIQETAGLDNFGAFVIDGINALEVSKKEIRNEFGNILWLAERARETLGIFISEVDTIAQESTRVLLPLVDIHIKLGTYELGVRYSSRYLEIVKCRTQMHIRGQQGMVISDGNGLYVLPSVAAQQSQIRDISYIRRSARFGIDGITPGNMNWRSASTTILSGPPGTKKFIIALHFLAAGLTEGGDKGSVMMISSKRGWNAIEMLAEEYPDLEKLIQCHDRVITIDITDGFVTPNSLVWRVFQKLRESRQKERPVVRAIFDDYRQLSERFPLLSVSKPLIPGLVRLFESSAVTTLFTHDMRDLKHTGSESTLPEGSIAHLADNVVQLSHNEVTNQLEICVAKTAGAEEHRWRKVRPVIYEYPKLYVGTPPANIQMHLFSDTPLISELNIFLKAHIQNVLRTADIDELPISAHQHQAYFRNWQQHAFTTSHDVCLIDVDEYFLSDTDLAEIFIPVDSCIDKNAIVQKAIEKVRSRRDSKVYLIPRYIDIGLWAYRYDVLEKYNFTAPETWSDVLDIAREIRKNPEPARKIIGSEEIRMLDFGGLAPESINCAFVEALYNNGGGIWREIKGKPENIDDEFILDCTENVETLILLLELLDVNLMLSRQSSDVQKNWQEMVSSDLEIRSEAAIDNEIPKISGLMSATNAIFYRHWYTSLAALMDEFPSLSESLFIQVEMPAAIPQNWLSITGEWYIGAAACSADREAALSIMENVISSESDAFMLSSSAALPLLKRTYEAAKKNNVTVLNSSLLLDDVIRFYRSSHAYSRRDIYGYNKMVPLLSKCFERIIRINSDFSDDELRCRIKTILGHYTRQTKLLLRAHQ